MNSGMDIGSQFISQITDLFRIGLLAGLLYTIERTRLQTGIALPLVLGLAFVAIIIPATNPPQVVSFWQSIAVGLVANAAIFAVLWLIWSAFKKKT